MTIPKKQGAGPPKVLSQKYRFLLQWWGIDMMKIVVVAWFGPYRRGAGLVNEIINRALALSSQPLDLRGAVQGGLIDISRAYDLDMTKLTVLRKMGLRH